MQFYVHIHASENLRLSHKAHHTPTRKVQTTKTAKVQSLQQQTQPQHQAKVWCPLKLGHQIFPLAHEFSQHRFWDGTNLEMPSQLCCYGLNYHLKENSFWSLLNLSTQSRDGQSQILNIKYFDYSNLQQSFLNIGIEMRKLNIDRSFFKI